MMDTWIRYLIALVIGFHGLVYLMLPLWGAKVLQGWKGASFLLGEAVTDDIL
jgi:hypothetical protein